MQPFFFRILCRNVVQTTSPSFFFVFCFDVWSRVPAWVLWYPRRKGRRKKDMRAFLDAPITAKENDAGSAHGLNYAVSSMQGWRNTMEDAHSAVVDIKELPGCAFFAVFDGHAGSFISTRR